MFQNSVFYQHINNIDKDLLKQKFQEFKTNYQDPTKNEQIKSSKEEQYQEGFLRDIFVNILGYTINPEPNFNLITEKRNESSDKKNTRKADAAIIIDNKTKCVIELKGCNTTNLNKVVSQVLDYKGHHSGCRYMVISNFAKLQFYIDDATKFIEFDLFNLDYDNFEKLYTLLAYEQIKADIPALIKEQSISREEDITKKFYKDYSDFKNALFDNICELNPSFDKLELFTKTQKLLDRFLFIFFCEDKGLLAPNSMNEILERYKKLKQWDEYKPLYDLIKKFFVWIDTGFKNGHFDIFAYNGGLFKTDDLLDNLKISDDLLQKHCKKLADYNFDSEISVDILGHIFEHSISEIEIKQNELKGIQKADKRKKDGVFYTPAYITKYIVESTLGTFCEAKKNELGINDADFADINANKRKDKISKIAILKKYREFLFGLKICDPACGSGAFLNATLKFLKAEHQLIDEMENNFYGTPLQLNYNDNKILENNIYGVDINSESVDIAKLSLWLNTAKKGEKLTTLTDNIKCGNSLISDEFDWQKEFPKVFENGGFDVIIGNPPYVKEYTNKSAFDGFRNSPYYKGKMDLWYAFVCCGIDLLRDNGILGFIAQNNWTTSEGASIMRNKVLKDTKILQMVDFNTYMVFETASIQTMIMVFQKNTSDDNYLVDYRKLVGNNYETKDIIEFLEKRDNSKIQYLTPQISRQALFNKSITFSKNKNLLNKIAENKLYLLPNEATNGIHTHHDCVTKNINQQFSDLKIGSGIFVLSQNERDVLALSEKESELIKPFFASDEISRFYTNPKNKSWIIYTNSNFKNQNSMNDYPKLKSHLDFFGKAITSDNKPYGLHRARDEYFFKGEKIVSLRKCVGKPCFSYNNFDCYVPAMYYVIKTERWNMKFLTCLLNSKLVEFWLRNKGKMQGNNFQIDKAPLLEIPIPNADPETQKQLADFADEMIRLNAEISSLSNDFFTILRANNYEIAKIPTALNEFYNLDFKEFLKLTKLKIDMSKQEDLLKFFNKYKQQCQTLNEQIVKTESKINQAVYKLYELNDDEIKMIENS